METENKTISKKINRVTLFFIWCAGSDEDILNECPKAEINKHVGIGGTVIFTSLLAFISGSYALYTIFETVWSAIGFGIVWSAIVFTIDRSIVSAIRKRGEFLEEFALSSPRIILATIIAITVSKPLEVRIFQEKIDKEIPDYIIELIKKNTEANNQFLDSNFVSKIKDKEKDIEKREQDTLPEIFYFKNELEICTTDADSVRRFYEKKNGDYYYLIKKIKDQYPDSVKVDSFKARDREEINGYYRKINANNKIIIKKDNECDSIGSILDSLKAKFLSEVTEFRNKANKEIASIDTQRIEKKTELETNQQKIKEIIELKNALPLRISLLKRLQEKDDADPGDYWMGWFIFLLFMAVELTPVFTKLFMPRGPYDFQLQAIEVSEKEVNERKKEVEDKFLSEIEKIENEIRLAKQNRDAEIASEKQKVQTEKEKIQEEFAKEKQKIKEETESEIKKIREQASKATEEIEKINAQFAVRKHRIDKYTELTNHIADKRFEIDKHKNGIKQKQNEEEIKQDEDDIQKKIKSEEKILREKIAKVSAIENIVNEKLPNNNTIGGKISTKLEKLLNDELDSIT